MANAVSRRRSRWILAIGCSLVAAILVVVVTMLNTNGAARSVVTTMTTARTTVPVPSGPHNLPTASVARDAQFLSDVSEVDPALTSYEKRSGNVALRSLLTDGTAFCAFLNRDGDLDTAMVSVVVGARHVESQTHLPLSVTTFNTVDSVALLTLCPSLQSDVPPADLAKIRQLGVELAAN